MFLGSLLEKLNPFARQAIKLNGEEVCSARGNSKGIVLDELRILKVDHSSFEQNDLFLQKIRQCCKIVDFKDRTMIERDREAKLAALNDLFKYIVDGRGVLTEPVYAEIIRMVSCNVIRDLPHNALEYFNPHMDDPLLEASWPQLEKVYNVFLCLLDSHHFKASIAQNVMDRKFVLQLLMLLNSADPRERSLLKWIIFRIYGKFYGLRSFIKNQIDNIFYQFIYIAEDFNGIAELLWILNTIIETYFNLALRPEHKEYLSKILMPLHKVKCLPLFHSQLEQSIIQFLAKDVYLIVLVVPGLIKFWPKTNTQKEVLFLNEIDSYLNVIGQIQFVKIHKQLFIQIAKCVSSSHMEVAEHALNLMANAHVMSLIKPNSADIMPIMFPALLAITQGHWNQTVLKRAYSAIQSLMEMNSDLFDELLANYQVEKEKLKQRQRDRELAWQKLYELGLNRSRGITDTVPIPLPIDEVHSTNDQFKIN